MCVGSLLALICSFAGLVIIEFIGSSGMDCEVDLTDVREHESRVGDSLIISVQLLVRL